MWVEVEDKGLGQTLISTGLLLSGQGLGTLATDAIWIGEGFSLQEEMSFSITLPGTNVCHPCRDCD